MDPYNYLKKLNKFGSKGGFNPGLQRVENLLTHLDHPEKDLSIIHVTGTNGKGSTIAFIKNIYKCAGYKVGVFSSPALFQENEMIQINDQEITTAQLRELIELIAPVVEDTKTSNLGEPSFFEVMTVLAFLHFYKQEVDLVLLEVGLGGRRDATNVIKTPLASVITSIGLEHTDILGDTLEDIAREKAGIIKQKSPVITAVNKQEALNVIKKVAVEKNAKLIQLDEKYSYQIKDSTFSGQTFVLQKAGETISYQIKLIGSHQVRNAILALAVVDELNNIFSINKNHINTGLKTAFLPGRMEIVNQKPLILLDGAHNEEGIKSLASFLKKQISCDCELTIIISILKDKNIKAMIQALAKLDNLNLVITKNMNKRALAPLAIKRITDSYGINSKVYSSVKKSLLHILGEANSGDIICITGSLYTVAEAEILLKSLLTDGINLPQTT